MLNSKGGVTLSFPSRIFPAMGLFTFLITIFLCVSLTRFFEHDIGGIYWPYLSDTGKSPPESALFAFGLTLTSVWLVAIVTLNYGRIKREIISHGSFAEGLNKKESEGFKGWRRNKIALVLGLMSSPFLGLLAVFDTARSPALHLIFVLGFFPFMVAYVFVNTSVYRIILKHKKSRLANSASKKAQDSLRMLEISVFCKTLCCYLLLVFVILYLPVGMSMVSDWYDYRNDVAIHTFRAVFQHLSVLCLVFYFGSFWFDFGTLRMTVIQTEDEHAD